MPAEEGVEPAVGAAGAVPGRLTAGAGTEGADTSAGTVGVGAGSVGLGSGATIGGGDGSGGNSGVGTGSVAAIACPTRAKNAVPNVNPTAARLT